MTIRDVISELNPAVKAGWVDENTEVVLEVGNRIYMPYKCAVKRSPLDNSTGDTFGDKPGLRRLALVAHA